MTKFRRQFQSNRKPSKGETNNLPSLTTPDMSLSILELLTNHSRGIHSDVYVHQSPQYFEQEIPKFDDITESDEYKQNLLFDIEEQENKLKQLEADKAAAKLKKDEEDAKRKKSSETAPETPTGP